MFPLPHKQSLVLIPAYRKRKIIAQSFFLLFTFRCYNLLAAFVYFFWLKEIVLGKINCCLVFQMYTFNILPPLSWYDGRNIRHGYQKLIKTNKMRFMSKFMQGLKLPSFKPLVVLWSCL